MWSCPICSRQFTRSHQVHSCRDKTLNELLNGKPDHTIELFYCFIEQYQLLGKFTVHPAKSMIAIAGKRRVAYIIRLGKNFVDVVFPFKQAYADNLCFVKIKQVPGTNDFNHHFRMCFTADLNDEVKQYMKLGLEDASDLA